MGVEPRLGDPLDVDVRRQPVRPRRSNDADRVARADLPTIVDRRLDAREQDVLDPADDDAAVDQPDDAAHGRVDRGAARCEQVDAEVDRGHLVDRIEPRVDEPRLAPTADGHAPDGLRRLDERLDRGRVADGGSLEGIGGRGQVEHHRHGRIREDRRDRPLDERPLDRAEACGLAERLGGERERHRGHRFERGPLGMAWLADVRVVRLERPWWSPLIATDAARATTSGHSAASSASVSGRTPVEPRVTSVAIRNGWSVSDMASAAIVTARSDTSHVRDRSPKSMIPDGTAAPPHRASRACSGR